MSEEEFFTASNGLPVNPYGWIPILYKKCTPEEAHKARAEFYQHLRDQELGRWRDPENPDIVVYPMGGGTYGCWVVDEKDPTEYEPWTRVEVSSGVYPLMFGYDTAKRYFEAHPETKPWHDAQPGEVWLVTFDGGETIPLLVRRRINLDSLFVNTEGLRFPVTNPEITHAEKIYPQEQNQ